MSRLVAGINHRLLQAYRAMPRLLHDRKNSPPRLAIPVAIGVGVTAIYLRQRYNFMIFLVVGVVCVAGMLIPNAKVAAFFGSIYSEQLAFKTILATFTACFILILITFFVKGPLRYRGRRRHASAYRWVERPALFGEDLSCVAAAVSIPLCVAVAVQGDLRWEHVVYPFTLGLVALLFRGMPWMVYHPLYRSGNMAFDRTVFSAGAIGAIMLLWVSASGLA